MRWFLEFLCGVTKPEFSQRLRVLVLTFNSLAAWVIDRGLLFMRLIIFELVISRDIYQVVGK